MSTHLLNFQSTIPILPKLLTLHIAQSLSTLQRIHYTYTQLITPVIVSNTLLRKLRWWWRRHTRHFRLKTRGPSQAETFSSALASAFFGDEFQFSAAL